MSTVSHTAHAPAARPFKPSYIARSIAFFSGTTGFAIKIALLSASNALAAWAVYVLIDKQRWLALGVVLLATTAIDWIYLAPKRWTLPAKFLVPGTIFLIGFQLTPILYTIDVAFSNYSTGHILTKSQAIASIKINSLQPPPNGHQYDMAAARDTSNKLVLILHDETTGKIFLGTPKGLSPLPPGTVKLQAGLPVAAKGYRLLKGAELFSLDQQLRTYRVPTTGDASIQPQGTEVAVDLAPTLRYDAKTDTFTRIGDGTVFRDNGNGSFVAANGEELEPGWKTYVGSKNFSRIANDPQVRSPFLSIFVWTFVFAATVVLGSFAVGLFLAIALDKKGLVGQRFFRSILIIPYAIPGFLSLLVWAGLLNDDFGVVNHLITRIPLLHLHGVPWLFGGNVFSFIGFISWPRIAVVLVSIWLTTPYFFLVSLGALQSIPAELTEAARVDGGSPWQVFRRVTLPLLLVAVAPLMIASFAFNFNNFNNVYLLTNGGPYNGASSVAGNTDILISYTYKLAIANGKGNDYGLASAIGIIIFFIVALISGISFWRSKTLETLR